MALNMLAANSPYWEEASFCKAVKFHGLTVEVIGTYSYIGKHLGGVDIESVTVEGSKDAKGFTVDISEMVSQSNLIEELEKVVRAEIEEA